MKAGRIVCALVAVTLLGGSASAQQEGGRIAQTLEQLYPQTPKPRPEMKCPPERELFAISVSRGFMDKQNLCLRAGRPFWLVAKVQFNLCNDAMVQCPYERQEHRFVDQGEWLTVLKRLDGGKLLYVERDTTPLSPRPVAPSSDRGYADVTKLEAPRSNH